MWRRTMTLVLVTAMAGAGFLEAQAGFLGVEIEEAPQGVRITRVIPGSPAEAFGLRSGYVISGLGAEAVGSASDFVSRVRSLEPGRWTTLQVISRGTIATSMITTQDREAADNATPFEPSRRGVFDITIEDHDRVVTGVGIMDVRKGGAGHRGGLLMGDVVLAVNGVRTEDSDAFLAEVSRHAGQRTPITLIRRERPITLIVVPDAMDTRGVFASIPEAPKAVADSGLHWCERSEWQSAACVIGAILMLGTVLDGESDGERESAKAREREERQQRERRTIQELERAIDTNEIRRRSLPD